MSSIQSLGISGIRGYSPQNFQKIEFMKPLTLIWGKNGSGKTTIIECLKYITTGVLPPNSDKGKSFIMDNKVAGRPQVIGDIRLIFKVGNRAILAKRRIQLSAKGQQNKFQSIQQVLKTKNQKGQQLTINHQCAEIEKQVPQFLGISKPILENIVFCHQDQSLWPFGDSTLLKNIFDQLFDTKKISKEMEKLWDSIKDQQTELKQLKVRLQYQKQTFKKQIEEKSKMCLELEQNQLKAQQLQKIKQQIQTLKQNLKDNGQKIKQRQKLIYVKGRIENSISNLQMKVKRWKETLFRTEKQYEHMINSKSFSSTLEQNSLGFSSKLNDFGSFKQSNFPQPSITQLKKIQFLQIQTPENSIQELEFKKSLYKQLIHKYTFAKEQHQNLKSFTQSTKRQQQIKSEVERLKNLMPEFKFNKDIASYEDLLRCMKESANLMEKKIQGKQLAKVKLQKMELPSFIQMGFSEKQIDEVKKESKELQSQIESLSVKILKIYKAQYKPIAAGLPSLKTLSQLQSVEMQFNNTDAILKSKREQYEKYIKMQEQWAKQDKKSLQETLNHYKLGGIDIQSQMLHFCEKKGKCYFCWKEMSKKDVDMARERVNMVKQKAQHKMKQIENQMQNKDDQIDPSMMVKKLAVQIRSLQSRCQVLRTQLQKLLQLKKKEKQIQINNSLERQLQKCNLTMEILDRLSLISEREQNSKQFYQAVSMEEFTELCSTYQIRLTRYKVIKQQVTNFQTNQKKNDLIKIRRQEIIRERKQLQAEIKNCEETTRNFPFLRNSLSKLQPLIRMDIKSKQKQKGKQKNLNKNQQSSSEQCLFSSFQQAQQSIGRLIVQIIDIKMYIQKLQISISHYNDNKLLQLQKQRYLQLVQQLKNLTQQLQTSEIVLERYNTLSQKHQSESMMINHTLSIISKVLSEPLEQAYLTTLNKTKHLQASISDIELLYHLMEEAVSNYHAQKMDEINQYIYELWRQIYHGDDIQYIEIEACSDQGSKRKKKNYQYKVLMKKTTKNFKNQQKVQMKGRCSTGQKVLASIVIRLALAEVFCGTTRILALDEPTTNLDKQHISNLANALLRLIELSGGKNLQLVIISHDIQFIKLLQPYADSYYEVKRDAQKFSSIDKKYIRQIFSNRSDN